MPLNLTKSKANNLHHSHQHIFSHQSSVSSTTSVQTVFHQSVYQSANANCDDITGNYSEKNSIQQQPYEHQQPLNINCNFNHNNGNSKNSSGNNIIAASNNQMILLGTSSSSASFQSVNGISNGGSQSLVPTQPVATANSQQQHNAMFLQQPISNSSNVSIAEEALSIGDVADLLHPQYAIITGGRSREGCPIITFPDHNNFHMLTEHDYEKLISYLTAVPP